MEQPGQKQTRRNEAEILVGFWIPCAWATAYSLLHTGRARSLLYLLAPASFIHVISPFIHSPTSREQSLSGTLCQGARLPEDRLQGLKSQSCAGSWIREMSAIRVSEKFAHMLAVLWSHGDYGFLLMGQLPCPNQEEDHGLPVGETGNSATSGSRCPQDCSKSIYSWGVFPRDGSRGY